MKAKNPRVTWGRGCWAECAQLSDAKRASDKPFRKWLWDATLRHGQVFGIDGKSEFIMRGIVFANHNEHGKCATMLIYRLHAERGWIPVWEASRTTEKAYLLYRANNRGAICTVEDRHAPRNPLAEVRGTKYFQTIH